VVATVSEKPVAHIFRLGAIYTLEMEAVDTFEKFVSTY
jgi:hypothetical protein